MTWLIGVGAAGGAVLRYLVGALWPRSERQVPVATLVVNVSGSFLLAVVVGVAANRAGFAGTASVLATGFLGGYTTFSTAMVEAVRLAGTRRRAAGMLTVGMAAAALAAAVAGLWLGLVCSST